MKPYISVWDPIVRIIHWLLVIGFILNYFILEAGSDLHQTVGYTVLGAVLIRIFWGFVSKGFAGFSHLNLTRDNFALHASHLKNRNIPANSGHNPIGWLMVILTWSIFITLAVTGFLLEEVDYFFGNSQLENVHSILADIMYVIVLIHIFAVLVVSFVGNISLITPMLTGKRKRN